MLTLGLDPGSRHTGYGLVSREGDRLRAVDHGRFSCSAELTLGERLLAITSGLEELLERWEPQAAAMETLFHGRNTRSLIILAHARGALLSCLARQGLEVREYSPAEVKTAVTGYGRAPKEQVGRMVRLLLALRDGPLSADAGDALAVALCCAQRHRLERLSAPVDSS